MVSENSYRLTPGVLTLERRGLLVSIVPSAGGRIAQIVDSTGRPWLVETGRGLDALRPEIDFTDGSRGGWDECLPSISPCLDPNPGAAAAEVADHGDFWFRPWRVRRVTDALAVLDTDPIRHSLFVRKTVELLDEPDSLSVRLEIENRGDSVYHLIYSAHPLWRWTSDAILSIAGAGEVRTSVGDVWVGTAGGTWPQVGPFDLATHVRAGAADVYKFFVRWSGEATLHFPADRLTLSLRQDGDATPWLGVCVNRDVWPLGDPGESWIAIEPTSSPTDSLPDACRGRTALAIAAGQSVESSSILRFAAGALENSDGP